MQHFEIQDPRTFGLPNKEKVKQVVELFFSERKEEFISAYQELTNVDKFYTLSVCVCEFNSVKMAKKMFLQELALDIKNLKILNKPSNTNLLFGYDYTGYSSADKEIWDRISLEYFNIVK
jgi:hypothetical protein